MSRTHIAKGLALRIHLKPAPRTHSESSAVLQVLQDLGPVNSFQIVRPNRDPRPPISENHSHHGAIAHVVFAKTTRALDELRKNNNAQAFTVTANDSHKTVNDPYNVLGHKHRKPQLQPRTIECCVIASTEDPHTQDAQTQQAPSQEPPLPGIEKNQYKDTFRVDRDSVFGEILARTGCPSGLIHGLLPRLRDEHIPHNVELKSAVPPKTFSEKEKIPRGSRDQNDRKTRMVKLDLERLRATGDESAEAASHVPYDEFASLRGVSLMEMYREATKRDEDTARQQDATFKPFAQ